VDVPPGDILVHAGDFCGRGDATEVSKFLDWMETLPHRTKIVVPGNHDICVEVSPPVRLEFEKSGIHLLIDASYTDKVSGLRFYGVPWTPDFYPDTWAFQYSKCGTTPTQLWNKVPVGTDVLISHGPPHGCADQIASGLSAHLGSSFLTKAIEEFSCFLRAVVCGHIHGGYGSHSLFGVPIINAAICTENYAPTNLPIVIDL
jgi:Icc-related predicted phosphoesterase